MEVLSAVGLCFLDKIRYPDIHIKQGAVTFICGKSGCGKTSLLRLFNATQSPSAGEVLYNGKNVEETDSVTLRREVMLVSQNVFLFDGTIEKNFEEYYRYRELEALTGEHIRRYLDICCADFAADAKCETLSGGERQRVFIAICLSLLPRVLMLDEPTSALDEATSRRFLANIKRFCAEHDMTLIAVSHDSALAAEFADEIIELTREDEQ